jgi:hypothetical protein
MFDSTCIQDCRHDVHDSRKRMVYSTSGEILRITCDERHWNTAFGGKHLVKQPWCSAGTCPSGSISNKTILKAHVLNAVVVVRLAIAIYIYAALVYIIHPWMDMTNCLYD